LYKITFFSALLLLNTIMVSGQYTINGSASQNSCNCYTLTQNLLTQSGSVWNNNRINLSQSFNFKFDVFLGCSDGGADGMAFVLQPISTSVGGNGSGMGYGGITPGVAVTLDTYQNSSPDSDPFYDHIAIQLNGNVNHNSPNTISPLTAISATNNNVEDCIFHQLNIIWDAATKNMQVLFDNQPRLNVTNDFVNNVFGGNTQVFWGFTGSTGALSNLQQFCTRLNPGFSFLPTQKKCVGQPIQFFDSTSSFGGLLKWYWNFGDGSPLDSINLNPIHTYTTAGSFTVTYRVIAIDGCESTFTQPVLVGSKPIANFSINDSCVSNLVQFTDQSTVPNSTINQWYWDLANAGLSSTLQSPNTTYSTPGTKVIKLIVTSALGCSSDTLYRDIQVTPRPNTDFTFIDSLCLGSTYTFTDQSTLVGGTVNYWAWRIDNVPIPNGTSILNHVFTTAGNHTVSLVTSGTGNTGCAGTLISKNVFVVNKPRARMRNLLPCEQIRYQLFDSSFTTDGFPVTSWWWDLGNGQLSNQQNPFVTYTTPGPKTILHVVYNSRNCKSDTMRQVLQVADKPIANFGFDPPSCFNNLLFFHDSSTVQSGTVNQWDWIYAGNTFSNIQHPNDSFPAGAGSILLSVTSSRGCKSDTVSRPYLMKTHPLVAMNFGDTCKYAPVVFTATETTTSIGINQWYWRFGDGTSLTGNPVTHQYNNNGQYQVQLYGISTEGCSSDTLKASINIYGTNAFAGYDTIAAANQPVRLQASGGISYSWSPPEGLSATDVYNPIATIPQDKTYYLKAFTPEGCESYDTINIKIYKGPEIYVPTAFTPDGDQLNDILHPIPIGIRQFLQFSIYNRYGQLVFSTDNPERGWDGRLKGVVQQGTFVWMASAIDFRGKPLFRKGTVMIIR